MGATFIIEYVAFILIGTVGAWWLAPEEYAIGRNYITTFLGGTIGSYLIVAWFKFQRKHFVSLILLTTGSTLLVAGGLPTVTAAANAIGFGKSWIADAELRFESVPWQVAIVMMISGCVCMMLGYRARPPAAEN